MKINPYAFIRHVNAVPLERTVVITIKVPFGDIVTIRAESVLERRALEEYLKAMAKIEEEQSDNPALWRKINF